MAKSKKKTDKFKLIAEQLLALLESGTKPWTRGWTKMPYCNALSGYRYSELNPVLAETSVMTHGYCATVRVSGCQTRLS